MLPNLATPAKRVRNPLRLSLELRKDHSSMQQISRLSPSTGRSLVPGRRNSCRHNDFRPDESRLVEEVRDLEIHKTKPEPTETQAFQSSLKPVISALKITAETSEVLPIALFRDHSRRRASVDLDRITDFRQSLDAQKFTSPYNKYEELLPQDTVQTILSEALTKKTTESQVNTKDGSPINDVTSYHEFRFQLLAQDPLRQGVHGNLIKWKAGDTVGQGRMGQVFRAMNVNTGEVFAVKRLIFDSGNDSHSEFVKSVETEVKILSQLNHPKIVNYLGSERVESCLCTYIEYLSGGSLSSILYKFGPLPESLVRFYLRQVLEGLAYLHNHGIIHRDVKCGNILVDAEGVAKLADFGCSALYDNASRQSDMISSLRGSILWMAPEVVKQNGYGRKADIWSLGCAVLEMLTAKPPWPGLDDHLQAILKIGLSTDLPEIPVSVSPQARNFLQRCLQRDPKHRASATELLKHEFLIVSQEQTKDYE